MNEMNARITGSSIGGAMALSIMATCFPCQGAITHVNPVDISIPTSFGGIYLDLNTSTTTTPTEGGTAASDSYTISYSEPAAGTWDINFIFGGAALVHSDSINIYRAADNNTTAVHNLGIGTLIDGNAVGSSQLLSSPNFGASGAFPADPHMGNATIEFTHTVDGYIGFVLDEASSPLYGWILVEFHDDGTAGLIKEWAFSDDTITVGQIPEPSVFALAAFAAIAVCRRRVRC